MITVLSERPLDKKGGRHYRHFSLGDVRMNESVMARSAVQALEWFLPEGAVVEREVRVPSVRIGKGRNRERIMDMVVLAEDFLYSVEFKLFQWRRALAQARDHKPYVDAAYVCLPAQPVSGVMVRAFEEAGVGLFLWTGVQEYPYEWPFIELVPVSRRRGRTRTGPRQELVRRMSQMTIAEGVGHGGQ